MNPEDENQCKLPFSRTGRLVQLLSQTPLWLILFVGLMVYVGIVFIVSGFEYIATSPGHYWVKEGTSGVEDFWTLIYFNLITILTIGYGEYVPIGSGARALSVLEALLGTGVMTITLSALIAKFLSPPKDAIVFSRYAYYCTEPEEFLVIFINTSRSRIVNPDTSAYFKLAGDWRIHPAWRSPLITQSVQTFHIAPCPEKLIIEHLDIDKPEHRNDVFRFGISGQLGGGSFSAAIEYDSSDIIVIENRSMLTKYDGFWQPNLSDPEFRRMFHYRPPNALTLLEHVRKYRGKKCVPVNVK